LANGSTAMLPCKTGIARGASRAVDPHGGGEPSGHCAEARVATTSSGTAIEVIVRTTEMVTAAKIAAGV
jgi:hypothetical protein